MAAAPLFTGHFQVAYVVRDLAGAQRRMKDRYGIESWHQLERSSMARAIALAYSGDLMIELIEPASDFASIYSEWLPDEPDGVRLHHLGFIADTEDSFDEARAAFTRNGTAIAAEGRLGDKLLFLYADTVNELGHYYELIHLLHGGRDYWARVPQNAVSGRREETYR